MNKLKILSVKDVCHILNISIATLYRWEQEKQLPFPKVRIGPAKRGKVGFRESDVLNYINHQVSNPEDVE